VGYHTITSSTGIGKIVLPGKMRRSPGHLDIVMDGVEITVYCLVRYHAVTDVPLSSGLSSISVFD